MAEPEAHEAALASIFCRSGIPHPQRAGFGTPSCPLCLTLAEHAMVALWDDAVAEGRRQAAADIRDRANEIAARSEVAAGVPTGAADDHPLMLGLEFAARLAEGDDGG